jgi:hypothetical protein
MIRLTHSLIFAIDKPLNLNKMLFIPKPPFDEPHGFEWRLFAFKSVSRRS